MKLYNTLTREVEELKPLSPPEVTVYTCGPTVYDYAHIGHWFTYIRADLLVQTLKSAGLQPKWVMNITDVGHLVSDADEGEDKLEKGARREGKTAWEVAEFYAKDFVECMKLLGIWTNELVKATDHIPEQIALIQKLEEKGYTYTIDDGVYYDTSKFEGYTAFARLDLDEQQGSGRVATNPQKRQQSDFALWKFSPKDHKRDMEWDSPWGKGFPGWHIECSAMSMKYLGETIDIHTGGIDHVPVHHTNEIAQSEAVTGKRFAQTWMHSNHVLVEGQKISKSLGNGIRLQEIIDKGISAEAVRLHVLESHYRSQSRFSLDGLHAAENRLRHWRTIADLRWQVIQPPDFVGLDNLPESKHPHTVKSADLLKQAKDAMEDDLNTPEALRAIEAFMDLTHEQGMTSFLLQNFNPLLQLMSQTLGIDLFSENITEEQKQLLATRQKAREAKDWDQSDQLRDQLAQKGIGVRDAVYGQVWHWL